MLLEDQKAKTVIVNINVLNKGKTEQHPITVDSDKAYLLKGKFTASVHYNEKTNRHYYTVLANQDGETLYTLCRNGYNKGTSLTNYLFRCNAHKARNAQDTDYTTSAFPSVLYNKDTRGFFTEDEVRARQKEQEKSLLKNIVPDDDESDFDFDDPGDFASDQPIVACPRDTQLDLSLQASTVEPPVAETVMVEKQEAETVCINGACLSIEDARKLLGISLK